MVPYRRETSLRPRAALSRGKLPPHQQRTLHKPSCNAIQTAASPLPTAAPTRLTHKPAPHTVSHLCLSLFLLLNPTLSPPLLSVPIMGFFTVAVTAFIAALGASLPSSAAAVTPSASPSMLFSTAQSLRSRFQDSAFAIDTRYIQGTAKPGGTLRGGTVSKYPVLGLPDINSAFARVNLRPGGVNLPHIHPRASETLYLVRGVLRVFIVEENPTGGSPTRVITNTLHHKAVAVFPQGLIHGQRCISRQGCEFIAVLGAADPGVITVGARFCDSPAPDLAAALGVPPRRALQMCGRMMAKPLRA